MELSQSAFVSVRLPLPECFHADVESQDDAEVAMRGQKGDPAAHGMGGGCRRESEMCGAGVSCRQRKRLSAQALF